MFFALSSEMRSYSVHKNDDHGAKAIAEAATRPTMPFVATKTEEQLDLRVLRRARERLAKYFLGRFDEGERYRPNALKDL